MFLQYDSAVLDVYVCLLFGGLLLPKVGSNFLQVMQKSKKNFCLFEEC